MADGARHVPSRSLTQARKDFQRLGFRRIVTLLVSLVIVPTVLLLAIGIISMFLEGTINLLFGILTVSFVAVVGTGVVLVLVFLRREANLSELQADFVAKVSHELRTPLTAIRLLAETAQRTREDVSAQEECLAVLVTESERLSRLIERLLDWGRMEAGRKLYERKSETVDDVVTEAVNAFAPHHIGAPEAIDLQVEIAPELPPILVDKAAFADALVNLLSNARKYGGTPPLVRLKASATIDGDVRFDIEDNGEGIPLGERRRIFEKFYRIDDRLSRNREGSGLGLAIVMHIARAHGARVVVDNAGFGKGARFSIIVPRAPEPAEGAFSPSEGELSRDR